MLENSIEINDLASSQKLQQYQALKNSKEIKHLGTLVFLKVDHQYRTLGSKCQAIFQVFCILLYQPESEAPLVFWTSVLVFPLSHSLNTL